MLPMAIFNNMYDVWHCIVIKSNFSFNVVHKVQPLNRVPNHHCALLIAILLLCVGWRELFPLCVYESFLIINSSSCSRLKCLVREQQRPMQKQLNNIPANQYTCKQKAPTNIPDKWMFCSCEASCMTELPIRREGNCLGCPNENRTRPVLRCW